MLMFKIDIIELIAFGIVGNYILYHLLLFIGIRLMNF